MADPRDPAGFTPQQTVFWKSGYLKEGDPLYGNPLTYSFADVHATLLFPFIIPGDPAPPIIRLPGLTLLSWSSHTDKYAVTSLGKKRIKGITRGNRTCAGTLGFTVLGESAFNQAVRMYNAWADVSGQTDITEPDTLPPLDLSLVFINARQEVSRVLIRGLEILDKANNISVQDVQLSEVYSFLALSITNLTHEERPVERGLGGATSRTAFSPLKSNSIGITKVPPSFDPSSTQSTTATTGTTDSTTTSPPTTTTTTTTTTPSTTPCVSSLAGQTTFNLSLTTEGWYDTGLVITSDQYLYSTAAGSGRWDPTYAAYPEGSYYPQVTYPGYYPPACVQSFGGNGGAWAADSCRPFSLVLAVKTDGTGEPGRSINYGLQPDREKWFGSLSGRIWAQFNDRLGVYGDNAGSFDVHLEIWDLCEPTTTTTLTTSSASTTTPPP